MAYQRGFYTEQEHPVPAVVLHWLHLVAFLALAFTGLAIHYKPYGWPMAQIINVHYLAMFVFALTTVVRIYWAFFGRGSANTGQTALVRDYKHFALRRDAPGLSWQYVRYYLFLRKDRPAVTKYNPLQKATYGYLFPLMVLVMAVSGFALYPPTYPYTAWYTSLVGGLNNVRLIHFLACFVFIALWMVHLYLVVFEDPAEVTGMLFHFVPEGLRPPSLRSSTTTSDSKSAS